MTASVYAGTWRAAEGRDPAVNVLITSLSHPYPDKDYLCILEGCYTIEFEVDGAMEALSFLIESRADSQLVELDPEDFVSTAAPTPFDGPVCCDGSEVSGNPPKCGNGAPPVSFERDCWTDCSAVAGACAVDGGY